MNNPPAFPRPFSSDTTPDGKPFGDYAHEILAQEGMTLRDYFAAKVVVIFLAEIKAGQYDQAAFWAFKAADAMLKARKQ